MGKQKRSPSDESSDANNKGDGFLSLTSGGAPKKQPKLKKVDRNKQEEKNLSKDENESDLASKVVYVGNLPHGFYEKELLGYFSQFGKLSRVRLSRNKKTGKAKHYAFLEFQNTEVARIVAEAMNGYFMFSQKITCRQMKLQQIHPMLFVGANQRFRNIPWRKLERQRHDRDLSPEEHAKRVARLLKKDTRRQHRIKDAGIDYEYAPLKEHIPPKPKKTRLV